MSSNSAALAKGRGNGTLTLANPQPLIQLDAFVVNGNKAVNITLSCSGQSAVKMKIQPGQVTSVKTKWTKPCSKITFAVSSSNGATYFDNLVIGQP